MGDYFINPAEGRDVDEQRRRSSTSAMFAAFRRPSVARVVMDVLYPADDQLVEPFSFVSTKISYAPGIKLFIGLLGQAGYTFGGVLLVDSLFATPGPAFASQGVGSGRPPPPGAPVMTGPDGMLPYQSPPVAVGAAVFTIGLMLGFASTGLFLADGVRIAGNRRKAFAYAGMHIIGIVLISMSKFIVAFQKNRINPSSYIALSLPSGLGRGIHFVTIPRSFSNSEVARNADFAPLSFEQRQQLSEALRVLAAVFFGLWAASWSVQNFNPLEREGWGILASLTLNVSAALPNTNLRRADIFRRSQTSLLSPQLNAFRIGGAVSPLVSPSLPGLPLISAGLARPPLKESLTYPMQSLPKAVPTGILRGHGTGSVAMSPTGSSSRAGILASMPMSRSYSSYVGRSPSSYMMNRQHSAGVASIESRFTDATDPLQRTDP
jgi:hypothetical protein